jgi:hypothetical protein
MLAGMVIIKNKHRNDRASLRRSGQCGIVSKAQILPKPI